MSVDFHGYAIRPVNGDDEWAVYCPGCSSDQKRTVQVCARSFALPDPPPVVASADYKRIVDRMRKRRRIGASHAPMTSTPTDTQQEAAKIATLRSGTRRRALHDLFVRRGAIGFTDDEIEQVTGWPHQSASACRNSLMLDGYLVDSGQRRKTRRGTNAIVWRTTN